MAKCINVVKKQEKKCQEPVLDKLVSIPLEKSLEVQSMKPPVVQLEKLV